MLVQKGKTRLEELRGEVYLRGELSLADKKAHAKRKIAEAQGAMGDE